MQMKFDKRGKVLIVRVEGRMDAVTAPEFELECAKQLDAGEVWLIADLAELEYISSAGLRSILQIAKRLQRNKGRIGFCGLSGMIQNVFSISGFTAMFSIFDTLDQALLDYER
jgi:anti-sigma B factor antagonist